VSLKFGVPPNLFSLGTGFFGIFNFVNNITNFFKVKGEQLMEKNKLWVKTGVATAELIVTASYPKYSNDTQL
jgi:hypothetical protein